MRQPGTARYTAKNSDIIDKSFYVTSEKPDYRQYYQKLGYERVRYMFLYDETRTKDHIKFAK